MKKITYVAITFSVIFLSCKKDNGNTPAPAAGTNTTTIIQTTTTKPITRADLYPGNGYISGTIQSSTSGNALFAKQFKHELDLETATYFINGDGEYEIHLVKGDIYGSTGREDKKTEILFTLKSDLTRVVRLVELHTSLNVDSTATQITKFNIEKSSSDPMSMNISAVTFDVATGNLKLDYSINVASGYTSSRKSATMVGQINTKLTNIRYRTGS